MTTLLIDSIGHTHWRQRPRSVLRYASPSPAGRLASGVPLQLAAGRTHTIALLETNHHGATDSGRSTLVCQWGTDLCGEMLTTDTAAAVEADEDRCDGRAHLTLLPAASESGDDNEAEGGGAPSFPRYFRPPPVSLASLIGRAQLRRITCGTTVVAVRDRRD